MDTEEINEIKQKVADAGRYIRDAGLVHGESGNVSIRIDEGRVAISPSMIPYDDIEAKDVLVIDLEGDVLEGDLNPSSESKMHLGIYKARPDVGAIVHTHPVYASAIAVCRQDIPVFIDEIVPILGGGVTVSEYGMPGSDELAQGTVDALGKKYAALVANHGAVACGRTIEAAIKHAESLERVCKIYLLSKLAGTVVCLPDDVVEMQQSIFEIKNSL